MTVLLDLPVELLEFIVNDVHVADIENFAASCKLIAEVAKAERALHHDRKWHYSSLNIRMDFFDNPCYLLQRTNPLLFLRDMCKDDSLSFYPRHIRLCRFPYDSDTFFFLFSPRAVTQSLRAVVQQVVRDCVEQLIAKLEPFVGEEDSTAIVENLEGGSWGVSVGVLLLILPNIEQLHVHATDVGDRLFEFCLQHARRREGESATAFSDQSREPVGEVLFPLVDQWSSMFKLPFSTTTRLVRGIINARAPTMSHFEIFSGPYSLRLKPFLVSGSGMAGLRCILNLRDTSPLAEAELDALSETQRNVPNSLPHFFFME